MKPVQEGDLHSYPSPEGPSKTLVSDTKQHSKTLKSETFLKKKKLSHKWSSLLDILYN